MPVEHVTNPAAIRAVYLMVVTLFIVPVWTIIDAYNDVVDKKDFELRPRNELLGWISLFLKASWVIIAVYVLVVLTPGVKSAPALDKFVFYTAVLAMCVYAMLFDWFEKVTQIGKLQKAARAMKEEHKTGGGGTDVCEETYDPSLFMLP